MLGAAAGWRVAGGGDCATGDRCGLCGALVELFADAGESYSDDHGECFGVCEGGAGWFIRRGSGFGCRVGNW